MFDAIFLLHPDPWPKNKHKKRRLLQQNFLDSLSKILKKSGIILVATDHSTMKSWILEQFHVRNDFDWKVKNINDTYQKPNFIVNSKYFENSININKSVNWFFFKKK